MHAEAARYLPDLLHRIDESSSLEDVRTICFELGVDYDNLPGETKEARIRELIRHLVRHDRLPELLALARATWPAQSWPDAPADLALVRTDPFAPPFQRLEFEPETVFIPAGPFPLGSDGDNPEEAPRHSVALPDYAIGLYPVTNEQYEQFLRAARLAAGPTLMWNGNRPPDDQLNYPVTGVTWYEALAYCRWLAEATGRLYTLPTEAQWEKAARGPDGSRFPWGDEWLPDRCHTAADSWAAVDAYPAQSAYGCFDLVGNAREWTLSIWGRDPRAPERIFAYPWKDDRRNDPAAPSTSRRIFRGGRAVAERGYRCSARGGFAPDKPGPAGNRHGFRVALIPAGGQTP